MPSRASACAIAQAIERLLATPKTIPVFPSSSGMFVPFGPIIATSTGDRQMREVGLRGSALAAEEVKRVAALPGIGRVADGAEGLLRQKRALAMVTGNGSAGRVHIIFATDL